MAWVTMIASFVLRFTGASLEIEIRKREFIFRLLMGIFVIIVDLFDK
jgi:hypothetical protein